MEFGPDGAFTITVDPTPADGRKNHIQTQPGCYAIWVRDALGDWSPTSANRLWVRRIDPVDGPPRRDTAVRGEAHRCRGAPLARRLAGYGQRFADG